MDSHVSAVGSVQLPFVGDTALGNTRAVLCEMCAGDDGEEGKLDDSVESSFVCAFFNGKT